MDSLLRADASITRLLVAARTMLIPDLDDELYEAARSDFDQAVKYIARLSTSTKLCLGRLMRMRCGLNGRPESVTGRKPIMRLLRPWTASTSVNYATQPDF